MICKGCGKEFIPTHWRQKYCSRKCGWTHTNHNRVLPPNVFYKCEICGKGVSKYVSPSSFHKNAFRFCSRKCKGIGMSGDEHPMWSGGTTIDRGYTYIYMPHHPNADYKGRIRQHRFVFERYLGRLLLETEVVHHLNNNSSDNRIENLMLFSSHAEHKKWEDSNRQKNGLGQYIRRVS